MKATFHAWYRNQLYVPSDVSMPPPGPGSPTNRLHDGFFRRAIGYVRDQVGYSEHTLERTVVQIMEAQDEAPTPVLNLDVHVWRAGDATCLSFPWLHAAAIVTWREVVIYKNKTKTSTLDNALLVRLLRKLGVAYPLHDATAIALLAPLDSVAYKKTPDGQVHIEKGMTRRALVCEGVAWIYSSWGLGLDLDEVRRNTAAEYDEALGTRIQWRFPEPPLQGLSPAESDALTTSGFHLYGSDLRSVGAGARLQCFLAAKVGTDGEVEQWVEKRPNDDDDDAHATFAWEANILSMFVHPCIVAPSVRHGNTYLEVYHTPLTTWTKTKNWQQITLLYAKLSTALAYLADLDFVHRDIKPPNILVNADERPLLADFEYAMPLDAPDGKFAGSPLYMPPEARQTTPTYSSATDVYALGVSLYVSLGFPFTLPRAIALYTTFSYCTSKPVDLHDYTERLWTYCHSLFAADPKDRPPPHTIEAALTELTTHTLPDGWVAISPSGA